VSGLGSAHKARIADALARLGGTLHPGVDRATTHLVVASSL
jgi:hypothetical protein